MKIALEVAGRICYIIVGALISSLYWISHLEVLCR